MTITNIVTPTPYEQLEILASKLKTGQVQVADICSYCDMLLKMGLSRAVDGFFSAVQVNHPHWSEYQQATRARFNVHSAGTISWSSRNRHFRSNFAVLVQRWPQYESYFKECESAAQRYQLHQSNDGNYQLRDTADPNPLDGWSGGLKDQKALASLWKYERIKTDFPSPVAFDGVGFGWLLLHVLETTRHTYLNYSPAAYIVEPDPLAIWILLHLHDLQEWLEHPRLQLFLGSGADEQYRDFLATGRHTIPDYCFANLLTQRPMADLVSIAATEFKKRGMQSKELHDQIEQMYAGRTPAWWQSRFEAALTSGQPLKILGITSRFTTVLRYSMEELAQAVRAAGHEFHLSMEVDDSSLERNDLRMIHDIQPDLLIQISRMRYENRMLPNCIPFLCWDQDYLPGMRTPEAKASLDPLTYVAGLAATYGYHEQGWPARNSILCHLAAATHRYSDQPVAKEMLEHYACDFSYVSNASDSPRAYARQLGNFWEAHVPAKIWRELIDQAIDAPAVNGDVAYWKTLIENISNQNGYLPPPNRAELAIDLIKIADRRFRHEALGWVADYCRKAGRKLKLYGRGWETNPDFSSYASGTIEPGPPLRALYQATKINLQLILCGFLHSRSLDGLAAGGFFLTRHSPADYDPDLNAPEFYIMARRAIDLGIWNFEQLVATEDPLIADRRVQFYVDQVRALQLSDYNFFYTAAELAAAGTVFSDMHAISFSTCAEFHALADEFLNNGDRRLTISQHMHKVVQQRFSYDARVQTFLQRIMRGLA